jgi:hypothetical protein
MTYPFNSLSPTMAWIFRGQPPGVPKVVCRERRAYSGASVQKHERLVQNRKAPRAKPKAAGTDAPAGNGAKALSFRSRRD